MEFELLGRKIDVRLAHIALFLASIIAMAILSMLIIVAVVLIRTGGLDSEAFLYYQMTLTKDLVVILLPLGPLLLLMMAGFDKMKKDVALCRSLAGACFLFTVLFTITIYIISLIILHYQPDPVDIVISVLSKTLGSANGAISFYLWLLIFLSPERKRLADAAIYAVFFAVVMLVISPSVWLFAFSGLQTAIDLDILARSFQFGSDALFEGIRYMILAMPLLYSTLGKKLDRDAAYLFAGLYLGAGLLGAVSDYLSFSGAWQGILASFITRAIGLGLLYLISRYAPPEGNL